MKTFLFVGSLITLIFAGLKLLHLIDWMWIGIISPVLAGMILMFVNWIMNYLMQMELDNRIKQNLKR